MHGTGQGIGMIEYNGATVLPVSAALALTASPNGPDVAQSNDIAVDLSDTGITDNDASPMGGEMNPDQTSGGRPTAA